MTACHKTTNHLIHCDEVIILSVKKADRLIFQRIATYILSTVSGALCSVILITLFALLMYALQTPLYFADYLSLVALGAGCLLSGFICGRVKKRQGLLLGVKCGAIMLALCFTGSLISGNFSGNEIVSKVITLLVTGCTGGVLGVNRD